MDVHDGTPALINPFEDETCGRFYRRRSAVILAGLPGIGKTMFLAVLFHLRVMAGLPTAYMDTKNSILIYKDGEYKVLLDTRALPYVLPNDAWLLMDSNMGFDSPPIEVRRCGVFFIQAASRRIGHSFGSFDGKTFRTSWIKHLEGPHQVCFMRPWTLGELYAASRLQHTMCNGTKMAAFVSKFGGSARHVYNDSDDLEQFECRVIAASETLDSTKIRNIMTSVDPSVGISDALGHMLITVLPVTDDDRTLFALRSPTPYLEDILLSRLQKNLQMARRELYIISVAVGAKATAADLLDRHHHAFISLGGNWKLRPLKKGQGASEVSTANTWRAEDNPTHWLDVSDGRMAVKSLSVLPSTFSSVATKHLTMVTLTPEEILTLQPTHFYRPTRANVPTFDSIYCLTPTHCIVFQAAKGNSPAHSVEPAGREWLQGKGIRTATYILVSQAKCEGFKAELNVPTKENQFYERFFHMILEYPALEDVRNIN
ncbi:hypothetical protein B0H16DRAFT_1619125 [Mycena metata]|uniref:Uncharacterized protein n=1 Tax=Mycena metata TaxID=1033252 RepID=A0AAD7H813_9AGAR|nr:hypothetical protein B0H16DRAFT_1619125 [Mycena metata]